MMTVNPQPRTWILVLIIIVSLAGFADAAYLTAKHYLGGPVPCSITGGCETVMTSRWAAVGPIPTAGFGAAYYLATFFLAIFYIDSRKSWTLQLILALTIIGLVVSLALLYLMAFIIHSYCQYCLLSDLLSAGLFALALTAVLQQRKSSVLITSSAGQVRADGQRPTTND